MYRTVISLFLYIGTTTAATTESDITYVKIHPLPDLGHQTLGHPRSSQYRESRIENIPLTIRGFVNENQPKSRHVRSDEDATFYETTTDISETTTEALAEESEETLGTDEYEVSKRPPSPRFYSKLSYFQKSNDLIRSRVSTNLVDTHPWRRKFQSKCRCERIWNCPKIQITVPRCPEEYFLCCFD